MSQDVQDGLAMLHTTLEKIVEFLVNYSFQIIGALLVLVIGYKVSLWTARITLKFLEKRHVDLTMARFASGTIRGLVLGFAVIVALGKFGITIAPIIAAIGAVAFGGTMAIQGVLSNLGSGLSLLLFRPFTVGNTITVAGVNGVVEEVKLGCTVLTNEDGERITVPNRHIVGEVLRNSFEYRIVELTVGIHYADDPARAVTVIHEAIRQTPEVATAPAPLVGLKEFGDSALLMGVRYWVPTTRYYHVSFAVNLAIFQALQAAKITIPFPQREVRLLQGP